MGYPPGHLPGFHFPGTNIPHGWIIEQEELRRAAQASPAAAARAADEHRRWQLERDEALRSVQRERDAVEAVLPGFPWDAADGAELAPVLERLVPDARSRFAAGRKAFGGTAYLTGWGFELGIRVYRDSIVGAREQGLIVTASGSLHIYDWRPGDQAWSLPYKEYRPAVVRQVSHRDLRLVRRQVLTWMGISLGQAASPRQHYLAETSGQAIFPPFDLWIRGWNG